MNGALNEFWDWKAMRCHDSCKQSVAINILVAGLTDCTFCAGSICHERCPLRSARGGCAGPQALQKPHTQLHEHPEAGKQLSTCMQACLNLGRIHVLMMLFCAMPMSVPCSEGRVWEQIAEHRLPKAYDYHRTPAPFIQVRNWPLLHNTF